MRSVPSFILAMTHWIVCWPAGGRASDTASGGGICWWPFSRPLWWSRGFHGNRGPQCYRIWGGLNANTRDAFTSSSTKSLRGYFGNHYTCHKQSFSFLADAGIWGFQERDGVRRVRDRVQRLRLRRTRTSGVVGRRGESQSHPSRRALTSLIASVEWFLTTCI